MNDFVSNDLSAMQNGHFFVNWIIIKAILKTFMTLLLYNVKKLPIERRRRWMFQKFHQISWCLKIIVNQGGPKEKWYFAKYQNFYCKNPARLLVLICKIFYFTWFYLNMIFPWLNSVILSWNWTLFSFSDRIFLTLSVSCHACADFSEYSI